MNPISIVKKLALAIGLVGATFVAVNGNVDLSNASVTTSVSNANSCEVSISMRSSVADTLSETWVLEQFHSFFVPVGGTEVDIDASQISCTSHCKWVDVHCVYWDPDGGYWYMEPCSKLFCTWECR